MIRLVLIGAVAFVVPILSWAGWQYWRRRAIRAPAEARQLVDWRAAPWQTLILIGALLAVVLVGLLLATGWDGSGDCHWVASQIVDGKLVPAHCQ